MSQRPSTLAATLERGARALEELASTLSDAEWNTRVPHDGRKIGVVVHHVANMYPLEIEAAKTVAKGQPIVGVTWDVVADINAKHATEQDGVTKQAALDALRANSAAAAKAIRALSDEELD